MSTHSRPARRVVLHAMLVLVISVGVGTTVAQAASLLTSRHVKDDSLRSRDFRNGSLTGVTVRDGTITARDIAGDVSGPPGPIGIDGSPGPPGIEGVFRRDAVPVTLDETGLREVSVSCRSGEFPLGGGASSLGGIGNPKSLLVTVFPISDVVWLSRLGSVMDPGDSEVYQPWILCAKVG